MPREILVDWTTPAGSGFRTVTMWATAPSVFDQREALEAFLDGIGTSLVTGAAWTIEQSGRELSDSTGVLTGEWSEGTARTGTGANSGECVPDVSQILVRWTTGEIENGRFVKGRTYIPGAAVAAVDDGNLAAANVASIQAEAVDLIGTLLGFGIWHRPVDSLGGAFYLADGASVWNEFAVLRQRRR